MTTIKSPEQEIADLAKMLYDGCLAHDVAVSVARHPDAVKLSPDGSRNAYGHVGFLRRKQGRPVEYSFESFIAKHTSNSEIAMYMDRALIAGSLITLGDALHKANYLDKAPILELVRHLRNGIAHGNKFNIRYPEELQERPAHNRGTTTFDRNTRGFEIDASLNGQEVLFGFIDPGDVVELLLAVHIYVASKIQRCI